MLCSLLFKLDLIIRAFDGRIASMLFNTLSNSNSSYFEILSVIPTIKALLNA